MSAIIKIIPIVKIASKIMGSINAVRAQMAVTSIKLTIKMAIVAESLALNIIKSFLKKVLFISISNIFRI